MEENVEGGITPFTDEEIQKCTDPDKLKKYYKLNGAAVLNGLKESARQKEIEILVLGAMALRGL